MRISIGTLALNICIAPDLGKYRATLVFSSSSTIIVNSIQALKVVWSPGRVLPLPEEAFSEPSIFLIYLTLGLEIN